MTRVGLTATAHYLPDRFMTAAEVAAASGIPEQVVVEKFGHRPAHYPVDAGPRNTQTTNCPRSWDGQPRLSSSFARPFLRQPVA